jgi:hypothetical protein
MDFSLETADCADPTDSMPESSVRQTTYGTGGAAEAAPGGVMGPAGIEPPIKNTFAAHAHRSHHAAAGRVAAGAGPKLPQVDNICVIGVICGSCFLVVATWILQGVPRA